MNTPKKALKVEKKLMELISYNRKISVLLDSYGQNFIVWSIAPLKKKNWNRDFINWCELLGQQIALQLDFYCSPAVLTFEGFIKLTFNF